MHLVTVNDYLAKRDAENMGRIHRFLGLSVGVILSEMPPAVRREQYAADITYGTNNEFGFDYLRDNMAWQKADLVQRGHNFAIVDEADSILIDEARTPLIISGPAEQSARWYQEFARMAPMLKRDVHYEVDERKRTVGVTEEGVALVEDQLGIDNLYEAANTPLVGYLNNALKVKELFKRDKDYIVTNGQVLIVDEFTGRVLAGRRYNEGMHQAIEAKEGVEVQAENQTLATITLQNYFRLYDEALGDDRHGPDRGGRAAPDLQDGRAADPDEQADGPRGPGRPHLQDRRGEVRRGRRRTSPRSTRRASRCWSAPRASRSPSTWRSSCVQLQVPHEVLNAKQHAREAAIIAQAGHAGAVTVATNMAGRGTDIVLGGNPEFLADVELRSRGLDPVETARGVRGGLGRGRRDDEGAGRGRGRGGARRRWPVRAGHRAARVAPHRQPAPRPLRPPGRPRRVAVLPVAGRRAHAPVQRRSSSSRS